MECQDCRTEMRVKRTYPSGTDKAPTTSRVHECACGSRFLSEEALTRRLPSVAISSPPVARRKASGTPPNGVRQDAGGSETARPCDSSIPNGGLGGDLAPTSDPPFQSVLSDPDPSVEPPQRVDPARVWTSGDWCRRFGKSWVIQFCRGAGSYGHAGDGKASGQLEDLIAALPASEAIAAQERSSVMFAEFFRERSKAVIDARHPFAFFVQRWGGLRVPAVAGEETALVHAGAARSRTAGNVEVLRNYSFGEGVK